MVLYSSISVFSSIFTGYVGVEQLNHVKIHVPVKSVCPSETDVKEGPKMVRRKS